MKRAFDLLISVVVLIIFSPLFIIVGIFISLESKGGVFFSQERIGKNLVPFKILKFRTMKLNSESEGKLTVGSKDNRITKVGYRLRKYKIDELPQFINVLKGEMSIVGPRPEVNKYVELYNQEQKEVLSIKPGITDYASLEYFEENKLLGESSNPEETYINEIMPKKLEINLKYVKKHSFFTDLNIIWKTFLRILS
ncbi:MAG: glycosyl transferase [Crocinitomicaceae bacterium]|nr:glycosyl transferase [Crocinitomicaceae bacterium]|tara:strand:- start:8024 stop:8611 length:588 start_codon:yes stop_codon:yes gene_type:complete